MKNKILLTALVFCSCSNPFAKDNEPVDPVNNTVEEISKQRSNYIREARSLLDGYGFVSNGGDVGDSALFTCIAYAGGLTKINIRYLFKVMDKGLKPIRHPEISPKDAPTPISKDMFNGIMTCLYIYGLENRDDAREIAEQVISFGRSNKYLSTWSFCTDDDKIKYKINTIDFLGRCVMTPGAVKDFFRLAIWLGWKCDIGCKITMATSPDIPNDGKGYSRHLFMWGTWRNGKLEGGVNDLSLAQLKAAAEDEPNNALYQAIYATYSNGDMTKTGDALINKILYPREHLPTTENYCTHYLLQRDEKRLENLEVINGCIKYYDSNSKQRMKICSNDYVDGGQITKYVYNDDWLPCDDDKLKTAEDWIAASAMYLGKL